MRVQGFLPKFGNVTIIILGAEYGTFSILTAYIDGIPVCREDAEAVADLIESANGELNAVDFCPRKRKKAEKILKRLRDTGP